MLPSPTLLDPFERARRAEFHLRAALQHVEAACLSQKSATEKVASLPLTSSLSSTVRDVHLEAPRITTMEWPLAPLTQRAKEKKARDTEHQRRRAARQMATTTAAAASMSAADKMRQTLSQPLGVMAARLLSAATASAPSLFSDPGAASGREGMSLAHKIHSSTPPRISGPTTAAATKTVTAAADAADPAAAARSAHTVSLFGPPQTGNMKSASSLSYVVQRQHRHQHHFCCSRRHRDCHHQSNSPPLSSMRSLTHYGCADPHPHTSHRALSTTPFSPRSENSSPEVVWRHKPQEHNNDTETSLLMPRVEASLDKSSRHQHHCHHCRHAQPSSKPISVSSAAKQDALLSLPFRTRDTPTSAPSPTHTFFSNSPISILARTFGGGGSSGSCGGGFRNSQTVNVSYAQKKRAEASAFTKTPTTTNTPATAGAPAIAGRQSFPSSSPVSIDHLPLSAVPPSLLRSHSKASCSCSCSCSCSSCSGARCRNSWTPPDSGYAFSTSSSFSSSDAFYYPMTAPGPDGQYNPHTPLPSLLRCYGDAETRHFFDDVSSIVTQRTVSRSSTPFSSEWSVNTTSVYDGCASTLQTDAGTGRDGPSDTPALTSNEPDGGVCHAAVSGHHPLRDDSATRQWQASPKGTHHHRSHSSAHSPNLQTQLSFATEMDAIERGQMAPYVSYLFAPEARVIDLRQLERQQVQQREPPPPASATCICFCQAGDAYLVGTSSGLLWRVPVGGGQEAVNATPLGSLWPPHAQVVSNTHIGGSSLSAPQAPAPTVAGKGTGPTAGGTMGGRADASSVPLSSIPIDAAGVLPLSSALPSTQPIPLTGHTAAILSIAFNDDGSLYATTGLDGCIIVWKASTSAKLRRISAVRASASVQRAPHLVRFMPQNNNYLLVSYVDSNELHLYNSSTGLPVTNVVGTGLTRMTICSGATGAAGSKKIMKGNNNGSKGNGRNGAITALAVSLIASPFFVSGDADGMVVLWTYRAGELVTWPTLRATLPPGADGGSGAGAGGRHFSGCSYAIEPLGNRVEGGRIDDALTVLGGGAVFSTPLYELPALRRVAAFALPQHAGGVAAISVSTLHAPQLRSLFHLCRPQHTADVGAATTGGGHNEKGSETKHEATARPPQGRPHHPLESTAQLFHLTAEQNRTCRKELEAAAIAREATSRSWRDGHGKSSSSPTMRREASESGAAGNSSTIGSGSIFPHVLAALPSRLSDTLSALWGSGGSSGGVRGTVSAVASAVASARHTDSLLAFSKQASSRFSSKSSSYPVAAGVATAGSTFNPATTTQKDILKQLCVDAMDVVCPLLILVTAPCDTVYSLGLLLQMQHSTAHCNDSAGSTHNNDNRHRSGSSSSAAAKPTVTYRLYPLLKTTGPSRMRHVGVGAVPSPDNYRLVVVAAACEEGFVHVLPLLRLETAAATAVGTSGGNTFDVKAGVNEAARVNRKHVLATLPMPYGGRCTGIAWSPSGRFLVAITVEGVIYEWSRVYLLSTTTNAAVASSSGGPAFQRTLLKCSRVIGSSGGASHGKAAKRGSSSNSDASPEAAGDGSSEKAPSANDGKRQRQVAKVGVGPRRWCGCDAEYSDAVHRLVLTPQFTSLLSTSMTAPAAAVAAAWMGKESDAACAAFSEEDAWRESLQRELERQRREQAALKLVTHPGDGNDDEVSSSGYWLDHDASSKDSLETFEKDEGTQQVDDSASTQ